MASVFKAYEASLDRYVALKVLPPEFLHDPTFAERFRREAQTIARLEHPQIIPIFAYDIDAANRDAVDGHAPHLGRFAVAAHQARTSRSRGVRAHPERRGGRARLRAQRGRDPSRRETAKRPARRFGARVPRGLRHREDGRGERAHDPDRHDHGHAAVHGARAGARQVDRQVDRHLRARHRGLRALHRPRSLLRGHAGRRADEAGERAHAPAAGVGSPGGSDARHPARHREGSGRAMAVGERLRPGRHQRDHPGGRHRPHRGDARAQPGDGSGHDRAQPERRRRDGRRQDRAQQDRGGPARPGCQAGAAQSSTRAGEWGSRRSCSWASLSPAPPRRISASVTGRERKRPPRSPPPRLPHRFRCWPQLRSPTRLPKRAAAATPAPGPTQTPHRDRDTRKPPPRRDPAERVEGVEGIADSGSTPRAHEHAQA